MSRFAEILKLVEVRSRMLCGLRLASVSLVGGGTLALIIALLRYTGILRCTRSCAWGLILLPLFGAALLYIVGWMRQIDLPRTLLRVDLSLETGERLSSLYELHRRGGSNVFRARLEEAVARQALPWKQGLPLGRARFALLGGGAAVLAAILLVAFAPPASLPVPVIASPIVASGSAEARTIAPASEPPSTLPGGSTTQGEESGLPGDAVPDRDLEDLLSELWESPASEGMLNEASGGSAELIRAQKERAKALADLLERIEERLKKEGGGLTPEERRTLSELAQQMGNAPLRQALSKLLQEDDPQALTEGFEKFRNLAESLADQQEGSEEETTPGRESFPPGETEEGEAQAAVNWGQPQPEEEASASEGASDGGAVSPSSGSQSDEDEDLAAGDEESFGSEEGAPGGESPFETSPGFMPSELAGMIGESGAFREFMTKGVPLEPILTQDGKTTRFSVDYDALRALLEERAIPTEAREIIRKYFETITQGGP
jgi:hypothetical protein